MAKEKCLYGGLTERDLQAIVRDYGEHLNERLLWKYTEFLQGARAMAKMMIEQEAVDFASDVKKKDGHSVYQKAMERFILGDLRNIHHYLSGREIRYTDHKEDVNGKLIEVRTYVACPSITYKEL